MIELSNGHKFEYVTASGAMGWGKGWLWDKPLIAARLIRPELFTNFIRTLTIAPRLYPVCNLSWIRPWTWLPWSPWSCVRFLPFGGAVNKVGLYNPGFDWWCKKVAPTLDFEAIDYAVSLYGTTEELVIMAKRLNQFNIRAVEVNPSCPNVNSHAPETTQSIVASTEAVYAVSEHPQIIQGLSGTRLHCYSARHEKVC